MTQAFKNVLIVGAGGNLGPSIVSALTSNKAFTVSVLTRPTSTSTFPPTVNVHKAGTPYSETDLLAALKDQDAVINLSPPMDIDQHKLLIDVAVKAGVKRYIPGEFGSNTPDPQVVEHVPIFKGKATIADYLKTKESEGMTWTGIITGGFFDWGLSTGFLGYSIPNHTATIYDDGSNPIPLTTLSTIGAAVASVLADSSLPTSNKYIYIYSFVANQNSILAFLEKAMGQTWNIEHTTVEKEIGLGKEMLAEGNFAGMFKLLLGHVYGDDGNWTGKVERANAMLGLEKDDLNTEVQKFVEGLKK